MEVENNIYFGMFLIVIKLFSSDEGIEFNPCSDLYPGLVPASEPEVQAYISEATRLKSQTMTWWSIHSFMWVYMSSYGHSVNHTGLVCPELSYQNELVRIY